MGEHGGQDTETVSEHEEWIRMKFRSYVRWIDGKKGEVTFENGEKASFSSPPEFGGVEGLLTPEELLVASLNTCYHQTLLTYAKKMRVDVVSLDVDGEGEMETVDGVTRFVSCVLRPRVTVASREDAAKVGKAISMAEKRCFISNSVNFEMIVEPQVTVG
jgi:organic hydroperoxide reductase OsmC/OhrA